MEHFITIITAILPIFIFWAINLIKSKDASNKIDRLKSDIEFTKETNSELREVLIRIYEGKVFLQNFGFLPLNYRVQAYLDFYAKSNISINLFKAFYNQGYLIDNKEKSIVSLKLGKLSKIAPPLYWFGFFSLIVIFGAICYLSFELSTDTRELGTLGIVLQAFAMIVAITCYYFAIMILKNNIFPYYEAKKIMKRDTISYKKNNK